MKDTYVIHPHLNTFGVTEAQGNRVSTRANVRKVLKYL